MRQIGVLALFWKHLFGAMVASIDLLHRDLDLYQALPSFDRDGFIRPALSKCSGFKGQVSKLAFGNKERLQSVKDGLGNPVACLQHVGLSAALNRGAFVNAANADYFNEPFQRWQVTVHDRDTEYPPSVGVPRAALPVRADVALTVEETSSPSEFTIHNTKYIAAWGVVPPRYVEI